MSVSTLIVTVNSEPSGELFVFILPVFSSIVAELSTFTKVYVNFKRFPSIFTSLPFNWILYDGILSDPYLTLSSSATLIWSIALTAYFTLTF